MDLFLSALNAATCGVIAVVLVWAIMSHAVKDGIIIKTGLIAMALGFGCIALVLVDGLRELEAQRLVRSLALINVGIAVCIIGYVVRRKREPHPVRRGSDWVDLDGGGGHGSA